MSVIKWRESYNTGIEQFDMEHHKIVELIDAMFAAIRDKSSKEVVRRPFLCGIPLCQRRTGDESGELS